MACPEEREVDFGSYIVHNGRLSIAGFFCDQVPKSFERQVAFFSTAACSFFLGGGRERPPSRRKYSHKDSEDKKSKKR